MHSLVLDEWSKIQVIQLTYVGTHNAPRRDRTVPYLQKGEQILYYTSLFMEMVSVELTSTVNVILIQRNQCLLAAYMGDKLAKDRTAVNVIMSEDKDATQKLRDFLTEHSIYNVATLDVDEKR